MKYTTLIRYGAMRGIGKFTTDIKNLRPGNRCIVRSQRGTELGEVLSELERIEGNPGKIDGTILRRPVRQDYERLQEIRDEVQPRESDFCGKRIAERKLPMRLVGVEHILGGEKVIFYFLADGRVDFRELVKDLAAEYRTRIELRQIGVRDEARLLAEYGHCGRPLCCRSFIKDLEPVTMRMAKLQKTTLDPAKISGRCGRLMCCLRFEDDLYNHLKRELPKKGTRVKTPEGTGEVIGTEILEQNVAVELPGRRTVKVQLDDIDVLPDEEPKKSRRGKKTGKGDQGKRNSGKKRSSGSGRQERRGRRGPKNAGRDGRGNQGDEPPKEKPGPPTPKQETGRDAEAGSQENSGDDSHPVKIEWWEE
ncbi:MAG: regulatory iron-sulfur-containing complex subunit RicT [Planctomycetota bacterium]